VQEVEDEEGQDDGPAPQHGPGSVGGIEIGLLDVFYGPGVALQEPELEGRPDVQADGKEQCDPRAPQEGGERFQRRRVMIDFFGWQEDLQIAEQVADDEAEQDEAVMAMIAFLPTVVCQKCKLPAGRLTAVALMECIGPSVCSE